MFVLEHPRRSKSPKFRSHNSYRNEWFVISLVDELWNTEDSWVNFLRRKGIGPSGRAFNRGAMLSTRPDVRDLDRKPDPATTAHPQLTGRHSPPTPWGQTYCQDLNQRGPSPHQTADSGSPAVSMNSSRRPNPSTLLPLASWPSPPLVLTEFARNLIHATAQLTSPTPKI